MYEELVQEIIKEKDENTTRIFNHIFGPEESDKIRIQIKRSIETLN